MSDMDDNPAILAFICDKCPCLGGGDDGDVHCNLGYEIFLTEDSRWAAKIDKCKIKKVKWRGGSFYPVIEPAQPVAGFGVRRGKGGYP